MNSVLSEMQASLRRYSKITSQVIQATVSIIDNQQIRISFEGGKWECPVGVSMADYGEIVRATLATGQPQVMLEPFGHPACRGCVNRDTCCDIAEMWVPIIASKTVLGVIGINCETARQAQRVRKSHRVYLAFLQQMADLISYEAALQMESRKNEAVISLLETVVDRLDSGVLVIDRGGNILRLNRIGGQILKKLLFSMDRPVSIRPTGEQIGSMGVYQLQADGEHCVVAGTLLTIDIEPYSQILIFSDASRARGGEAGKSAYLQITGVSAEIQKVREQVRMAAGSSSCVLICAENGLGKSLYARAIHDESDRRDRPFVTVDCSLLPEKSPEEALFGSAGLSNVAGARGKPGEIEAADGGTLFLDNVDALTLPLQQQLVKMLEQRKLTRVGSRKQRRINIRVIASAEKDLPQSCAEGGFDRDLYYLLNVIPITIPPLRARPVDARLLAVNFLNAYAREMDKTITRIDEAFWQPVESFGWPGNIRELRSVMEYVANLIPPSGVVGPALLPGWLLPPADQPELSPRQLNLEEVEKQTIRLALEQYDRSRFSMEKIAGILGIGPATLYRKIKKYGL